MYGTSARKVRRIAERMGVERLDRDRVSAIAATPDAEIADLAEGRSMRAIPYIRLDATYVKCRRWGRAATTAAPASPSSSHPMPTGAWSGP